VPNARPEAAAFRQLADECARRILDGGHADVLLPGFAERNLVVRTSTRAKSPLQRVVVEAVRAGLMQRDARGRFVRLDPKVKRAILLIQKRRTDRARPTRAQVRADQQAVFAALRAIE